MPYDDDEYWMRWGKSDAGQTIDDKDTQDYRPKPKASYRASEPSPILKEWMDERGIKY